MRSISFTQMAVWFWLVCGLALTVLAPAWRGVDPWFGWRPYWLVVAPALDLVWLHRARLWPVCKTWLRSASRRRRPARQARRLRRAGAGRRWPGGGWRRLAAAGGGLIRDARVRP